MSLLLNVIFATHARSTHHKLALDALKHLQGANMGLWADAFISHHAAYLEGAKAPDDDFKDFKNHVLHVRENFWGGAVSSAHHWYGQLVDHLRGQEWKDAAYAAGVLSHYYSDPLMPFHTGQSEAEGAVHRAAEWSVTKSYESLRSMIEEKLGGYPNVAVPDTDDWLGDMVRSGATMSNQYYELVIDHYNLSVGVKDPPNGFDDVAREAIAKCLAHATIGLARILERAFEESLAVPPEVTLTLPALMATINVPYHQILRKLGDSKERKEVEAIFREVQETGKAIQSLPESERLVRQFHATEVLKVPLSVLDREKPKPAGSKYVPPAGSKPAKSPDKDAATPQPAPIAATPVVRASEASAKPVSVNPASAPSSQPSTATATANTVATAATVVAASAIAQKTVDPNAALPKVPELAVPVNTAPIAEKIVPAAEPVTSAESVPVSTSAQAAVVEASSTKQAAADSTVHRRVDSSSRAPVPESAEPAVTGKTPSTKPGVRRFHLRLDAPIVDAPSIGPKTATRFQQIGLKTISDLLEGDAEDMARRISTRHITADVLRDWQAQSLLMVDVPGLRGHDAQLLVASEVRDQAALRNADAESLLEKVLDIARTPHGRSILRDSTPPDLEEVENWIAAAVDADRNGTTDGQDSNGIAVKTTVLS